MGVTATEFGSRAVTERAAGISLSAASDQAVDLAHRPNERLDFAASPWCTNFRAISVHPRVCGYTLTMVGA